MEPGIYHIYNRANGNEKLFKEERDYEVFLSKVRKYLVPYMKFYAYCLIPNHFHFLIKIEEENSTCQVQEKPDRLTRQFKNFFSGYSKWFNIKHDRSGGLFMTPYKKKRVESDNYYTQIIAYIHRNPVHHKLTSDLSSWRYSSYNALVRQNPTLLQRDEVLSWFGGKSQFIEYHEAVKDEILNQIELNLLDLSGS